MPHLFPNRTRSAARKRERVVIDEPDIPWPDRHDRTCRSADMKALDPEHCWRCASIQDSARDFFDRVNKGQER